MTVLRINRVTARPLIPHPKPSLSKPLNPTKREFSKDTPWADKALNMIRRWLCSDLLRTNGRPTSDADGHIYLILYGQFFKYFSVFFRHRRPIYMTLGHAAGV